MKRTPAINTSPARETWATAPVVRVLGVDNGLASVGLVVLSRVTGTQDIRVESARALTTQKAAKKDRRATRVSVDDQRRLEEIWMELEQIHKLTPLHAVSSEYYQPNMRQTGAGNAGGWKAALCFGMCLGFARSINALHLSSLPLDLKRPLTGRSDGSKADVQDAVRARVQGWDEAVARIAKTRIEHVSDAAGHALLGFKEIDAMLGLGATW